MDCLRWFSVTISSSASVVSPEVNFWGLAPENYWIAQTGFSGQTSRFFIEGFKNINIYKVKAVGNVISTQNTGNLVLVENWIWFIKIGGVMQNIGGTIRQPVNKYQMLIQNKNPDFLLDKFNRTIEFMDPITSCTFFEVLGLQAQGIGAQNLTTIDLQWNMTFVIYYKFEGEDERFALL